MRFEKVSLEQYKKDFLEDYLGSGDIKIYFCSYIYGDKIESIYNNIILPSRATKDSAGYDFKSPLEFTLNPGDTIKISTGIRVILDNDKFLLCAPRSSQGFKARVQLDNTVGVIDADYSNSENEGHIMLKLTNDSRTGQSIKVNPGDGIMQAIILGFHKVEDDNVINTRNGGIGSTNKEDNHD